MADRVAAEEMVTSDAMAPDSDCNSGNPDIRSGLFFGPTLHSDAASDADTIAFRNRAG
jgi:hypothetical protein